MTVMQIPSPRSSVLSGGDKPSAPQFQLVPLSEDAPHLTPAQERALAALFAGGLLAGPPRG